MKLFVGCYDKIKFFNVSRSNQNEVQCLNLSCGHIYYFGNMTHNMLIILVDLYLNLHGNERL
jgi:hypothetical protein